MVATLLLSHRRLIALCVVLCAEIAVLFPEAGFHDYVATVYIYDHWGWELPPFVVDRSF